MLIVITQFSRPVLVPGSGLERREGGLRGALGAGPRAAAQTQAPETLPSLPTCVSSIPQKKTKVVKWE